MQALNRIPLDSDVANLLDKLAAECEKSGTRLDTHAVINAALRTFLTQQDEATLAERVVALETRVGELRDEIRGLQKNVAASVNAHSIYGGHQQ